MYFLTNDNDDFSNDNIHGDKYSDFNGSIIKPYVDNYVNMLNNSINGFSELYDKNLVMLDMFLECNPDRFLLDTSFFHYIE